MKWWWSVGLIVLAAGCSQPADTKTDACPGGGDELVVEGDELCVYDARQSTIIETGFQCPPERPDRADFGDLIVCADGAPPDGTADELERAYPGANLGDDACANVLCDVNERCVAGTCETEDPNNENNPVCTPTTEICGDSVDNDCDQDVDCDDPDCAADPACAVVPSCDDTDEPNDTPAQVSASLIAPATSALCGSADVDYWRIDAQGGDRLGLAVTLDSSADVTIEIVDAAGELAYDEQAQPLEWTGANLPSGSFVSLRRGEQTPIYIRISGAEVGYEIEAEYVTPIHLGGLTEIGAGDEYTCALEQSGTIMCWGSNEHLQLGDRAIGSSADPLALNVGLAAGRLWVGPEHSCAMLADLHPYCWGENSAGEVGVAPTGSPVGNPSTNGLVGVQEMALGRNHTCALFGTGEVQCWGDNSMGQLGDNTFFGASDPVPHTVSTIADATSIAAGDNHTCVTRADSSVWCWGSNDSDQLCDPFGLFDDWTNDPLPIDCISGAVTADAIAAAGNWTVAHEAGFGSGWGAIPGFDAMGGVGAYIGIPMSSAFDPVPTASRTWTGPNSWCRLESQGLACMGHGPWMQNPILSGGNEFASTTGGVYGFYTTDLPNPLSVALGSNHHCAVQGDGRGICWGYNSMGQLGNGTTNNAAWPVYVSIPGD